MTLAEVSDASQTIAAVGVIVSLVYLALQTRLSAQTSRAMVHEHRLAAIGRHVDYITDVEFGVVFADGASGAPELSDRDAGRFLYMVGFMLMTWEERFRQSQEGTLDSQRWRLSEMNMANLLRQPGFRAAVQVSRTARDPAFLALLDRLIVEGRRSPAINAATAWRAVLDTEVRAAAKDGQD